MTFMPLLGLILTGGVSARMGTDKAHLVYEGEPQLLRIQRILSAVCSRVYVSARADQDQDCLRSRFPMILDQAPPGGPLAGISAAQALYPDAAWLVAACDLPFVNAGTANRLVAARSPAHDVTAFSSMYDGLPEPLFTIWEPSSRHQVAEHRRLGLRCARHALGNLRVNLLTAKSAELENVNTAADYRAALLNLGFL